MTKHINKFITDTLQIKGKWSMKRVIVAVCFPHALFIAQKIVINDNVNSYAIMVLQTIFAFITAVLITSAYSKKEENKHDENINHE